MPKKYTVFFKYLFWLFQRWVGRGSNGLARSPCLTIFSDQISVDCFNVLWNINSKKIRVRSSSRIMRLFFPIPSTLQYTTKIGDIAKTLGDATAWHLHNIILKIESISPIFLLLWQYQDTPFVFYNLFYNICSWLISLRIYSLDQWICVVFTLI